MWGLYPTLSRSGSFFDLRPLTWVLGAVSYVTSGLTSSGLLVLPTNISWLDLRQIVNEQALGEYGATRLKAILKSMGLLYHTMSSMSSDSGVVGAV